VSALLGFMSVSGLLGNRNLKHLEFELEPPSEIYAGNETLVGVKIRNRRRRVPAFLLDISLGGKPACLLLLRGGETERVAVPATFARRGIHKQHRIEVTSNFPINFFIRSRARNLPQALTVFPRPRHCATIPAEDLAGQTGEQETNRRGLEGEISRIDDYRSGDPLKMIHWKLSARQDTLKVKQLSATAQPPVEIDPLRLPGRSIEEQLSCACYLIDDYIRRGHPVGLKLGKLVIPAAEGRQHKIRLLTELAHYDQG